MHEKCELHASFVFFNLRKGRIMSCNAKVLYKTLALSHKLIPTRALYCCVPSRDFCFMEVSSRTAPYG